jgi:hypothetical protein
MPNAARILCLAVGVALTAVGSRSQQRPAAVPADKPPPQLLKQWEKERQGAVVLLQQALARAKTAEERAWPEQALKRIESGEAAREDERMWRAIMAGQRAALAEAKTDEDRARIAKQIARLERGLPALDEKESLELAGYKLSKPAHEPRVYQNATHGYQLTFPAGVELQEHRNGSFVIVPSHGTLFGTWIHAESSAAQTEAKLLTDFERWCGEDANSARERALHGGSLRLVPIQRGTFAGYKAVAKDQPDEAPTRFYAFKSPREDGYFGCNLTPSVAQTVIDSLQPLAPADGRK